MQTQTTIESVERTPKGAYKITFMGGAVAGTADAAIGDEAIRIAGQESPNPVQVTVEKIAGDKLEVKAIEEITAPEELGGEPEPAASEDVAKTEAVAPGSDPTGEQTLDEALALARTLPSEVLVMEIQERLFRLDGLDK